MDLLAALKRGVARRALFNPLPALDRGWQEARGSRPRDLQDDDVVERRRNGDFLPTRCAAMINWDLWCEYRVLPTPPPPAPAYTAGSDKTVIEPKRSEIGKLKAENEALRAQVKDLKEENAFLRAIF